MSMQSGPYESWVTTISTSATGATDLYNGNGNSGKIIGNSPSTFPAAKHCYDYGSGWYLPAQGQLMLMWSYHDAIPRAEQPGHDGSTELWSSTENTQLSAYRFDFNKGEIVTARKDMDASVRCVRDGVYAAHNAWKYPKVESGNTIVSRDIAGGIKTDALLTDAQENYLTEVNAATSMYPNYDEYSDYNKVSAKFQVAKSDAIFDGQTEIYGGIDSYNACYNYTESGTNTRKWRVPTQRELMIIYLSASKLTACDNFLQVGAVGYWSGTQDAQAGNNYDMLYMMTSSRQMFSVSSTSGNYLRCVRDL